MEAILLLLMNALLILFILRAVISWFRIGPDSPFFSFASLIFQITEPVLGPIRRVLPPLGGIDLSVLLVIIAINYFVKPLIVGAF